MDKLSMKELLHYIDESIDVVKMRFVPIESVDDFLRTPEGNEKLDAIILRIQTIGEAIKNIDKHHRGFMEQAAPAEYWSHIIKLRELISHHYLDLDAEIIFDICEEKLDELQGYIRTLERNING